MRFKKKQSVFVAALRKHGTILEVQRSGQRYKVQVGDLVLHCKAEELRLSPNTETKKSKKNSGNSEKQAAILLRRRKRAPELRELDLHACRVNEALSLVEQAISDALVDGVPQLRVIHGIGSGALKRSVHQYLAASDVVRNFSADPGNPGQTNVYLAGYSD